MSLLGFIKSALLFLFGESHNAMYTGLTFVGVNAILDFFRKYDPPKKAKQIRNTMGKKLLAYAAFVVIAARIDSLNLDTVVGWEGSTQFLVFLYIIAREGKSILDYIKQQGIDVPTMLSGRVDQIGKHGSKEEQVDPSSLDDKIAHLQQQIASIQEKRENKNQDGGERP